MEKAEKKKKGAVAVSLAVIAVVLVGIPLACAGVSLIGRITPESVLPDSFTVYMKIPDTARCAERMLAHESLGEILADPALSSVAPAVAALRDSGILGNHLVRFLGKGNLEGALFADGRMLLAYDAGLASPLLALAPFASGLVTVKNLYYVRAGRNSRFEYRTGGTASWFASPCRNLVIVSNDSDLLESVLANPGASVSDQSRKRFGSDEYDIGFLFSAREVFSLLAGNDETIRTVISRFSLPDTAELTFRIEAKELDVALKTAVSSETGEIASILGRDSVSARLTELLPDSTQYGTLLSGASLKEIVAASRAVSKPEVSDAFDRADRSAKSFLGMGLDELLYSWAGSEFAAFALEGRPRPVFALQVADEKKRKEVFDAVFSSLAVTEDTSVVLDGMRIPQIRLPDFLSGILGLFNVSVPMPYYAVESGYLLFSESPENLLSAVSSMKKGKTLVKTDLWKALSASGDERSSLTLFYSLDRAVPFFLKGNTSVHRVLKLYRQGLVRASVRDGGILISLAAIPGSGGGVSALSGYPLDLEGRAGRGMDGMLFEKRGESRIFTVVDGNRAVSIDPVTLRRSVLESPDPVWCVPAEGLAPRSAENPAVWIVSSSGDVTLANGNLEAVSPFPVSTGLRLSSKPAAHAGRLYLSDSGGGLRMMDASGALVPVAIPFAEPLRAPPVFASSGKKEYMAAYPKSFAGRLWLMDDIGTVLPGWPVPVSGIAFGSPVLMAPEGAVSVAFLAQNGELSAYDLSGQPRSGFPVKLPGVFFFQPVYDGVSLWAVSSGGVLYQVSLGGSVLSQQIPDFTAEEGMLAACDVDDDGMPEIFVSGDGNALFGYSRNFTLLDGFPLPVWGTPFFADFNGDGSVECAGVGLDNRAYAWQFRKERMHR